MSSTIPQHQFLVEERILQPKCPKKYWNLCPPSDILLVVSPSDTPVFQSSNRWSECRHQNLNPTVLRFLHVHESLQHDRTPELLLLMLLSFVQLPCLEISHPCSGGFGVSCKFRKDTADVFATSLPTYHLPQLPRHSPNNLGPLPSKANTVVFPGGLSVSRCLKKVLPS